MKFSEMEYRRVDAGELIKQIGQITEQFCEAEDARAQYELILQMDMLLQELHTMSSLVYVRYTVNTKDKFYASEMEYCQQIEPQIDEALVPYNEALLGSAYRSELEKITGSYMFALLEMEKKSFTPEITQLVQEEHKLAAQYQAVMGGSSVEFQGKQYRISEMAKFSTNADRSVRKEALLASGRLYESFSPQIEEIFDRLVKNRTLQAKTLGFDSYVELAYLQHRRCFTLEDARNYRKHAVDEVLPIVTKLKQRQAERIGVDKITYYDMAFKYPDGNAAPVGAFEDTLVSGYKMYCEMSPETKEFINEMYAHEMFDVLAKDGKTVGGYCTSIPKYKCPFIFANFNGTAGDVDVFTHEAGHAYAFYKSARLVELSALRSPTAEACEVHSMSMEFFTEPWYHLFFGDQTEKYIYAHLENALDLILRACQADHFQEEIYLHPDMSKKERNDLWKKVEGLYRPYLHAEGLGFYERGADWQRQHHYFTHPYYFIDYSLAQTVALQFYMEIEKDWDKAWEKYNAFVYQGGTKNFIELVQGAGLQSPFEKGCLQRVAEHVEKRIS